MCTYFLLLLPGTVFSESFRQLDKYFEEKAALDPETQFSDTGAKESSEISKPIITTFEDSDQGKNVVSFCIFEVEASFILLVFWAMSQIIEVLLLQR